MLMMLAMVMTTIMPAPSHAYMNHQYTKQAAHSEDVSAHDHADCDHHHAEKSSHDKQASKDKPCCEKDMCKCLNGNCHGEYHSWQRWQHACLQYSHTAQFAFADQYIESATLARLKRPPRA